MISVETHRPVAMFTAVLATVIVGVLAEGLAAAQTDAGALRVLVADQSRAVVPGATRQPPEVAAGGPIVDVDVRHCPQRDRFRRAAARVFGADRPP